MRKQLLYCLLACVVVAPLLLIAKSPDGTLRPVWAKAKPSAETSTPKPDPERTQPMATMWVVSGAGDAGYNGIYSEAGTYNGQPCYKLDNNHWLFCSEEPDWPAYPTWSLGPALGGATVLYYSQFNSELPGNSWQIATGTSPAPIVTEGNGHEFSYITVEITSPEITPPAIAAEVAGRVNVTYTVIALDHQPFTARITEQTLLPDRDNPGVLKPLAREVNVDCLGRYDGTFPIDTRAFADGLGYIEVFANRTDGYTGYGSDSVAVDVNNDTGTPEQYPPQVYFAAPANGATVSGDLTITVVAEDAFLDLETLTIYLDSTPIATRPIVGHQASYTGEFDTTTWSDGNHVLSAKATNVGDLEGENAIIVTVDNGVAADTTIPTVSITEPADEAEVTGDVRVNVTAGDNVGLLRVELAVDAKVVKSWQPGGAPGFQGAYSLNSRNLVNGEHTITATATDTSGNVASTAITVTTANVLALSQCQWVSAKASEANRKLQRDVAKIVGSGNKIRRIIATVPTTQGATPEENYAIDVFACIGGEWEGFDACQRLIPDRFQLLREPCEDLRLAVRFTPLVSWDSYALTDAAICDHQLVSESRVLLMLPGPPVQILSWTGSGTPTTWYDLTGEWCAGYAGVGFRVLGNRLYIAANTDDASPQPVVIVQELDGNGAPATDAPYGIEVSSRNPHQMTDIEVSGGKVWVCTDDSAGAGHLWTVDGDDLTLASSAFAGCRCLWAAADALWVGTADGKVYRGTTLQFTTGEAHVNAGVAAGTVMFALTGTAGKVFAGPPWDLFATATALTEPAAVAYSQGRLWVGGNGGELYCYDHATRLWQLYKDFADLTAITQLVVFGGALWVFGAGESVFRALRVTTSHLVGRYMDGAAYEFYAI